MQDPNEVTRSQWWFWGVVIVASLVTLITSCTFVHDGIRDDPTFFEHARVIDDRRNAADRCTAERLNDVYSVFAHVKHSVPTKDVDCKTAATGPR